MVFFRQRKTPVLPKMKANLTFFIFFSFAIVANPLFGQNLTLEYFDINEQGFATVFFEGLPGKKGFKKELILVNSSDKDLIISKVEGGCECVKTKVSKKKLKPNQSTKLLIRWSPPEDTEFSSSISIFSNDTRFREIWVQMLGNLRS